MIHSAVREREKNKKESELCRKIRFPRAGKWHSGRDDICQFFAVTGPKASSIFAFVWGWGMGVGAVYRRIAW